MNLNYDQSMNPEKIKKDAIKINDCNKEHAYRITYTEHLTTHINGLQPVAQAEGWRSIACFC